MDDWRETVFIIFSCLVIAAIFYWSGRIYGYRIQEEVMQEEAVKAGHAEYNSHTGEWQWREKP